MKSEKEIFINDLIYGFVVSMTNVGMLSNAKFIHLQKKR